MAGDDATAEMADRPTNGGPSSQDEEGPEVGTHVVHVDNLETFLDSGHGGTYLGGRVEDAADPMDTGIEGTQPQVGESLPPSTRQHLAEHVGMYRAIVEKPARDVWSRGWHVDTDPPDAADAFRAFDRNVRVWPTLRGARTAFRRAHRLSRRDGLGLVHVQLRDDAASDEAPEDVQEIHALRVLPPEYLGSVEWFDKDESQDRFGLPESYELYEDPSDEDSGQEFHWQRVIPLIHDPWDGIQQLVGRSAVDGNMHNAQGAVNVAWAASEAYYQRASPYLVVTVNDNAVGSPDDKSNLDEKVNKLQSGQIQKIRLQGAEIETLTDSEKINDPTPFMEIHREDAAAGEGIPKRELTGSEAGELAAAKWDARRYHASVVQVTQEEFAEAVVLSWYERLLEWGLVPEADVLDIRWPPHRSLDDQETADRLFTLSRAAKNFQASLGELPQELLDEVTLPDEADGSEEGLQDGEEPFRVVGQDLRIWADERVARLEERFVAAFQRQFDRWATTLDDHVEQRAGVRMLTADVPQRDALLTGRDQETRERVHQALSGFELDDEELQQVWAQLQREAGQIGATKTWEQLGRDGILEFVETTQHKAVQQAAEEFSQDVAERFTRRMRGIVADGIAEGKGLNAIRRDLQDAFANLRNEHAIARTEAMRGYNRGALSALDRAGIKRFKFVAYPGACPICQPLDGNTYTVAAGVDPQDFPSDVGTDNLSVYPPVHVNCRCAIVAAGVGP